ncbi:hypothetical protein J2046_002867 [Rhizobium petrolearium]|nr:hypothetical protein [Neorhizobium petrolearium]MBP1844608.1 hypothetical protein [Neorhizobium petrolearium]
MPSTPQPGQQDDRKSGQDKSRPDDKSGVKAKPDDRRQGQQDKR